MHYVSYLKTQEGLKELQKFYIVEKMFKHDSTIDPKNVDFEEVVWRGRYELPFFAETFTRVHVNEAIFVEKLSEIWWRYIDDYGLVHRGSYRVEPSQLNKKNASISLLLTLDCHANSISIDVVVNKIVF